MATKKTEAKKDVALKKELKSDLERLRLCLKGRPGLGDEVKDLDAFTNWVLQKYMSEQKWVPCKLRYEPAIKVEGMGLPVGYTAPRPVVLTVESYRALSSAELRPILKKLSEDITLSEVGHSRLSWSTEDATDRTEALRYFLAVWSA